MRVFVILLNWNRRDDTLACLASLAQQTIVGAQIVVVDQGSTDNSVDEIKRLFPNVSNLQNRENIGFARGMNVGIQWAMEQGADWLFLLNNDTIADPKLLERLLEHRQSGYQVLSPAIFYVEPPTQIWSIGGGIHNLLLEMTGDHGRNEPLPRKPIEREFLSGCALLVQRTVFDQVGLFDERFFMYYEDLDFCLRNKQAGIKMLLVPDAHLWHKVSQSSGGANSPNERYHMARSSGIYFRKHMKGVNRILIPLYRIMSFLRWSVRLMSTQQRLALRAFWRGLREGWFTLM